MSGAAKAKAPWARTRLWLRLVGTAVLVGLAVNYIVYSFPLDQVVVVYDRY